MGDQTNNNESNPLSGTVPWSFPLAIPAATGGTQVPVVITNTVQQS